MVTTEPMRSSRFAVLLGRLLGHASLLPPSSLIATPASTLPEHYAEVASLEALRAAQAAQERLEQLKMLARHHPML